MRLIICLSRTHRERKEVYIKALEEQVMSLKETFVHTVAEKNTIAEENQRLKELLQMHGIPPPGGLSDSRQSRSQSGGPSNMNISSYTSSATGSRSGSYAINNNTQGFTPPTTIGTPDGDLSPKTREAAKVGSELLGGHHQPLISPSRHQRHQQQQHQHQHQQGFDHDQVGIDFVLTSVERGPQKRNSNHRPLPLRKDDYDYDY